MEEIFIINSFPTMLLARFGILLLLVLAFIWLYSAIRLHFSKSEKFNLRISTQNSLIESSLIAIVLFALYFSLFITMNEWQRFVWDEWRWTLAANIYFMLLPEIILFILLNILFFTRISNLSKTKKI
jgi:hypothetical protein